MKRSLCLLTAGLVFSAHSAFAEDSAPKPDDSKVNAVREQQKLPTADNSGNSKGDVNLADGGNRFLEVGANRHIFIGDKL